MPFTFITYCLIDRAGNRTKPTRERSDMLICIATVTPAVIEVTRDDKQVKEFDMTYDEVEENYVCPLDAYLWACDKTH